MSATRAQRIHQLTEVLTLDTVTPADQLVIDRQAPDGTWDNKRISAANAKLYLGSSAQVIPTDESLTSKEIIYSASSTNTSPQQLGLEFTSITSAATSILSTAAGLIYGTELRTSSSIGNATYFTSVTNKDTFFSWRHKFYLACCLRQTTQCRCWYGLTTTTAALWMASNNPAAVHIGFRYSTDAGAGDTTWKAVVSDGVNQTVVDTLIPVSTVRTQNFRMEWGLAATSIRFYIDDVLVATITTNLPAPSTDLRPVWGVTTLDGSFCRIVFTHLKMRFNSS